MRKISLDWRQVNRHPLVGSSYNPTSKTLNYPFRIFIISYPIYGIYSINYSHYIYFLSIWLLTLLVMECVLNSNALFIC